MSEQRDLLFDGANATTDSSGRQTLSYFTYQFRRHEWLIFNSQDTLRSFRDVFDAGQRVWPPTCDDAIHHLTALSEHSRKFHASIQRSRHLPLVIVPLRLDLLLTLKNIDQQIMKLIYQLAALRDAGRTALSQPSEDRRVIVCELDILIRYCEQALKQADDLLRRAEAREYSIV
jgi:hypothetical protein